MKTTIQLGRPLPLVRLLSSWLLTHPRLLITLLFTFVWLTTIAGLYPYSSHDPSSFFYSQARGHEKIYSTTREAQAQAYISTQNANSDKPSPEGPSPKPQLCLGVATVARPNKQYISLTVGSLLEGLTASQRSEIHFVFFIAHTDSTVHPVHSEPWTKTLPDTLLTYDGLPAEQIATLKKWETEHDYRSKGLFDYSYLLQACHDHTLAPYIAIIEGDVLAVRNWYPRALAAAEHIDNQDPLGEDDSDISTNPDKATASWLYLRLFFTETYLGWNKEEWPTYLAMSSLIFLTTGASLIALRATFPYALSRPLSNPTLLLILFIYLPSTIILYFALGRPTVSPLPHPYPAGVQVMSNFGCCSQGFIYARRMVPFLRARIAERVVDYVDMMMEAIAGAHGLQRWVVNPSLLQHIGGVSSKGDAIADARAELIWSFGFERWNSDGAIGLR
jgi:hypothetical protein